MISAGVMLYLTEPLLSDVPAERAFAGLVLSFAFWGFALLLVQGTFNNADVALFAITPLTPRLHLFKSLLRLWPMHVLWIFGAPIAALAFYEFRLKQYSDPNSVWPWPQYSFAILGYYAMMLAPIAERLSGTRMVTGFFLLLRHPFRIYWYIVVPLLIVGAIANWMSRGVVFGWLEDTVNSVLATGNLGFMIAALLSPGSAIVVRDLVNPSTWCIITVGSLWVFGLIWSVNTIVGAVLKDMPQWEHEGYEQWLDERGSIQEHDEARDDEESERLEYWSETLHTFARDSDTAEQPAGYIDYDSTCESEEQILRNLVRDSKDLKNNRLSLLKWMLSLIGRYPWPSATISCWLVWAWVRNMEDLEIVFGAFMVIAVLVAAIHSGGWWKLGLTSNLALPVRMTEFLPIAFKLHQRRLVLFGDALAVGLLTVTLEFPYLLSLVTFLTLSIMRIAGYLTAWLSLVEAAGHKKILKLYDLSVLLFLIFMWLVIFVARVPEVPSTVATVISFGCVLGGSVLFVMTGIILLKWLHRRADSCVLRNATSYPQQEDDF